MARVKLASNVTSTCTFLPPVYRITKNKGYLNHCGLPRVKLREGPLPITLVPNT